MLSVGNLTFPTTFQAVKAQKLNRRLVAVAMYELEESQLQDASLQYAHKK
jgi:hypothetical protein